MKKLVSVLTVVLSFIIIQCSVAFADSAIDTVANLQFPSIPNVTIDTLFKECGLFTSVEWFSKNESIVVASCAIKDAILSSGLQALCYNNGGDRVLQDYVFKTTSGSTDIIDLRYIILKNNSPVRVYSTLEGTLDTSYLDSSLTEIFGLFNYNRGSEERERINAESIMRQKKQLADADAKAKIEREASEKRRKVAAEENYKRYLESVEKSKEASRRALENRDKIN